MRFAPWWVLVLGIAFGLPAQAQARFSYSGDGSEVTDSQSGLTWRRCVEGMAWSGGACTGTPVTYSLDQAMAHMKKQSGWRIPTVKELGGLVDLDRAKPSIDPVAFPGTPTQWHWTSTPFAAAAGGAWGVNFTNGSVDGSYRYSFGYVLRLVR